MLKLRLLLILIIFVFTSLNGQNYVQLEDDVDCGVTNRLSIYATPDDVILIEQYLKKCDDLEYIRIKGFKPGPHWDRLFSILQNHKRLKGIELFYNDGLTKVPTDIKKNPNLRVVSIIGNKQLNYDDLFKKLSGLDSLQKISLIDNKLKNVPNSFKKLKKLKQLHVSGNENLDYQQLVESLKESELEELSIPLNSLSDIPENIKDLKKLKVLDIRKNYISELPENISELDSLQEFKSEENIFLDINDELAKLKGLNIKYLSFDPVQEEELGEIKSIFPNATIEKKEGENLTGINLSEDENGSSGDDFETTKLKLHSSNCFEAIKLYNSLFHRKNNYLNYDSLGFFERLSDVDYCYNEKVLADGRFEGVELMSHNKFRWKKNVNFPKYKTKKGEIAFSICPEGNLYPEINAFTGMLWVYVGDKSKRDFIKTYVKSKKWKDVFIEFDESNETFFIVLKGDYLEKIPAYPRYVNPQSSLKHAKLHYEKKFQMYERRLELRAQRFNQEVDRVKQKSHLRKRKIENQNWSRLKTYMCPYEKGLNRNGWLAYRDYCIKEIHKPIDTVKLGVETIKLSAEKRYVDFQVLSPSNGKNIINNVVAKFSLSLRQRSGEQLKNQLLIFYPSSQQIVQFNGEVGSAIELKPNLDFIVIVIKDDSYACFYTKEEFMKEVRGVFSENGAIDFIVTKVFKDYNLNDFWKVVEQLSK